jgi:hypothetical protein
MCAVLGGLRRVSGAVIIVTAGCRTLYLQGVGRCNYSDCRVSRAVFDSSCRVLSAIPIVIPAVYSAITRVAIGEYTLEAPTAVLSSRSS